MTELVPIGLPQLAKPSVDAECIFAYMGESEWPEDFVTSVKATEMEKE